MSRCGCSSVAATGAAITDSDCISVTGAGTPQSPFAIAPVIDPDSTNLLECTPDGLYVPDPDDPGAWISYTPTWTASGSSPSAPPGSLVGFYRRRGQSVEVSLVWTAVPGTGLGTGTWRFGLPSGLDAVLPQALAAVVGVASTDTVYSGSALVGTGDDFVSYVVVGEGPSVVGASTPVEAGWENGSFIVITGIYHAT